MPLSINLEYNKLVIAINYTAMTGYLQLDDKPIIPVTGFVGFTGAANYHTPYGTLRLSSCMRQSQNISYTVLV